MLTETLKETSLAVDSDRDVWHKEYEEGTLIDAMEEARRICRDPRVEGYTNMEDLRKALLSD